MHADDISGSENLHDTIGFLCFSRAVNPSCQYIRMKEGTVCPLYTELWLIRDKGNKKIS